MSDLKHLLKIILTLVVVTAVSAGLLAGANLLTAPIIARQQEEEYRAALQEYFPQAADYKRENLEGDAFDLVYDAAGGLLGVMASTAVQGYGGPISYNLAVDKEGRIVGLRIVEHSETQGVGDVIEKSQFQQQFIGKGYRDPLKPGEDVDTVSGATISTSSLIESIRSLLTVVAENFLQLEDEEAIDISAVPDGTYRGTGEGLFDKIVVDVTVAGGRITVIEIVEHSETPTYMAEAAALIPPQIIDQQSLDVDTKTGATGSSNGIVEAVRDALIRALNPEGGENNEE
ncbi:MAG: FMN-binding protein [Firmicutes bacterium]|nr:FMN-binding protein [Bacillota bacterium]HPU01725.1 FMN-binding protein [Bacillota bacterium]